MSPGNVESKESDSPVVIENGVKTPMAAPMRLNAYLKARGYLSGSVVVELNGQATPPSEFAERWVEPGARLEIVRVVAGG